MVATLKKVADPCVLWSGRRVLFIKEDRYGFMVLHKGEYRFEANYPFVCKGRGRATYSIDYLHIFAQIIRISKPIVINLEYMNGGPLRISFEMPKYPYSEVNLWLAPEREEEESYLTHQQARVMAIH
ncbi:MAG: hypothetical protein QXS76_00140 [Candidatus Bathyarchaeia archaeon]